MSSNAPYKSVSQSPVSGSGPYRKQPAPIPQKPVYVPPKVPSGSGPYGSGPYRGR
jgi:hypothetical protein